MEFEFDPNKSAANKEKHGLDFVQAQAIWADDNVVEIAARSEPEARTAVIGRIDEVIWLAIVTRRGDRLRIISARRAHENERKIYHSSGI
jgi:uncharacterized protein